MVVAVRGIAVVVLETLDLRFERVLTRTLAGMFGFAGLQAGPPPPLRTLLRVHTLMEARITSTSDVLLMLLLGVVHRHASKLKFSWEKVRLCKHPHLRTRPPVP